MADWIGWGRTNAFTPTNRVELEEALEPFAIKITDRDDGKVVLTTDTEFGDWPSVTDDEEGEEITFSFPEHVMPFVAEAEVVVAMESGHELARYMTGWAEAYIRRGNDVQTVGVNINDVYQKAAAAFGVAKDAIAAAQY